MRHQLQDYQAKCDTLVGAAEQRNQYLSDILVTNNVKITELENQVANQYRENSALRQDLEANSKRNIQHVRYINKLLGQAESLELDLISALSDLDDAKNKISYRFYNWASKAFAIRKQRMINAWKALRA
jgi:arginine deiminase